MFYEPPGMGMVASAPRKAQPEIAENSGETPVLLQVAGSSSLNNLAGEMMGRYPG
jgi:hypothetical protein